MAAAAGRSPEIPPSYLRADGFRHFPGNESPLPRIFLPVVFIDRKFTRRGLLSSLAMLPAAHLLRGQQNPPFNPPQQTAPKYEADVKVVNVFATVRDRYNTIVKDLLKEDFKVEEEGQPQTIKYFAAESSLPLHLGLLVDTSASQGRVLSDERSAGIKFFDQILRPDKDQAFVLHFDYDIELLQDFTPSRQKLDAALNLLEVGLAPKQPTQQPQQQPQPTQQPGNGYPPGGYPPNRRYPQGGGYPQGSSSRGSGGTKLYDAVLLAAEDMMAKQEGRKALIILTDGVDTGSKVTLYQAITAAQKADTLVYSVLFADDEAYGTPGYPPSMGRRRGMGMPMPPGQDPNLPDGKKVLKQIADETGGSFNQVSYFHKIDRIFADIEEELRNQYNIGYTPETAAEAGSFRHIRITAHAKKKTGLSVKARAGYYAG